MKSEGFSVNCFIEAYSDFDRLVMIVVIERGNNWISSAVSHFIKISNEASPTNKPFGPAFGGRLSRKSPKGDYRTSSSAGSC